MKKEEIVLYNKQFGIDTIFSSEIDTVGYKEGNVIYLNDSYEDLEKINKHELLHFFEESIQFKKIKEIILSSLGVNELKELRKEYNEVYSLLYSDEINTSDLIDNEIVIDFILKDRIYSVNIDDIVKNCFETIVNGNIKMSVNKRYLNIVLSKKIEQQFPLLNKWEKLFVLNYYKKGLPTGKIKYEIIRNDIKKELERLYSFSEDKSNFIIETINNNELVRELNGEISIKKSRGEIIEADRIERNFDYYLSRKADKISESLHAEYKHIVDFIKTSEYDEAFVCLMLNETLTKTYRHELVDNKSETIISKRDLHKSICSHMTLNRTVLDFIYNNLEDYSNFSNLYYAGLAIYNNKISESGEVNFSNLKTFSKGKWIRFDSKKRNPEGYVDNVQRLSSLVQNTPWCTKQLAGSHLEQGDFYVFLDNDNNPHIAIKMDGKEIDEVRGLKNGNAQELEEEYRDVAIEFLRENKDIENGVKWLEKEEWNKRLVEWIEKINEGTLKEGEVSSLLYDLFVFNDYKAHYSENSNRDLLRKIIKGNKAIISYLTKTYDCKEEEIYFGTKCYIDDKSLVFPYSIIVGGIKFIYGNKDLDMSKLKSIYGIANFSQVKGVSLPNLSKVFGNVNFVNSSDVDLSSLEEIYGVAEFRNSGVRKLSNLRYISLDAFFDCSDVEDLSSLEYIGREGRFVATSLTNIDALKRVEGDLTISASEIASASSLEFIGGSLDASCSSIKDFSALTTIKNRANFSHSVISSLANLEYIGGFATFTDSVVTDLSSLRYLYGGTCFSNSEIEKLDSLEVVCGGVDFEKSNVKSLKSLKYIRGSARFANCEVSKLPSLIECDGFVSINDELNEFINNEFDLVEGKYIKKIRNNKR